MEGEKERKKKEKKRKKKGEEYQRWGLNVYIL